MIARPERPGDHEAVAVLVEAAFGRPDEARMVAAIRASDRYVPELALVAEEAGEVVGHLMLSYVDLGDSQVLELAPMAVAPAHQGRGVGSALVRAALEAADERGEPLVLVLGHARYYPRFGFRPASALGIEPPFPLPDDVWMAIPLRAYDASLSGRVAFPPAFSAGEP